MELEKRAAKWPEVTSIGDVFHPYIPMMKIYSIYVNDYDDFLAMVSKYVRSTAYMRPVNDFALIRLL